MSVTSLFRQAWDVVWNHKFMIGLGLLAGIGANTLAGLPSLFALPSMQSSMLTMNPAMSGLPAQQQAQVQQMMGMQTGFIYCFFIFIGIPLWVLARVSLGGIVTATRDLSRQQPAGFNASIGAGWARKWPLLGIGFLSSIPLMLLTAAELVYSTSAMSA